MLNLEELFRLNDLHLSLANLAFMSMVSSTTQLTTLCLPIVILLVFPTDISISSSITNLSTMQAKLCKVGPPKCSYIIAIYKFQEVYDTSSKALSRSSAKAAVHATP